VIVFFTKHVKCVKVQPTSNSISIKKTACSPSVWYKACTTCLYTLHACGYTLEMSWLSCGMVQLFRKTHSRMHLSNTKVLTSWYSWWGLHYSWIDIFSCWRNRGGSKWSFASQTTLLHSPQASMSDV